MNALVRLNRHHVLAIIVLSQFMATSLWFAGNAIVGDLKELLGLYQNTAVGYITSAVQLGFIMGTFTFALLTISDRFSPSRVFFSCALTGAFINLGMIYASNYAEVLTIRFLTGFCLAGIYPVGMKIAADYHEKGLGMALGYLVGALVIGTALPHLLKALTAGLSWEYVITGTSALAALAGIALLLLVPDGPYRKQSASLQLKAFANIFRLREFRKAAFGYFGHMWELYTFWAFVPLMIQSSYAMKERIFAFNIPMISFMIIAIGGFSCVLGGHGSKFIGSRNVARYALMISGLCCLLSPFIYSTPAIVFLFFMLLWGMAVIADSPQFSTLVAKTAPDEVRGTALTIVNSIGFALTIVSIQLANFLLEFISIQYLALSMAIGPLFGLISMSAAKGILPGKTEQLS